MAKLGILNMAGQSAGDIELKPEIFELEPNIALMHQVVLAEEANGRQGTSNTKTRSFISGGGAKPFRQKGTGRARQGSIRSPHMYHGAVVFGPHPRSYEQNTPKKMRRGAVRSALSARLADGDIIIVDDIKLDSISTKSFVQFIKAVSNAKKTLIILDRVDDIVWKSARNIPAITVRVAPVLSARDLLNTEKIIMVKGAVAKLEEVLA